MMQGVGATSHTNAVEQAHAWIFVLMIITMDPMHTFNKNSRRPSTRMSDIFGKGITELPQGVEFDP